MQGATSASEYGCHESIDLTRMSLMELFSSFRVLFEAFSPVFSPACFPLWQTLMTGWVLSHRHRYISDLIVSGDAMLCRKRGFGLFGVGMHHDPLISSRGLKFVSWGHDGVLLTVVIAGLKWAPPIVLALPIRQSTYFLTLAGGLRRHDNSKAKAIPRFSRPHLLSSRSAEFNQGRYAKLELSAIAVL